MVLVLVVWLNGAIRSPDQPLKVLALAWLFVLDTVINSVYTALFGASWFIVLAQHLNDEPTSGKGVPGADTINDTAGFTDPEHNVSKVDVVATPASGVLTGQDAVAAGTPSEGLSAAGTPAVFQSGSMASVTVISALWAIRLYFCLIILSYARSHLRNYVLTTSTTYTHTSDPTMAENPFREGREEGAGWKGKLGRIMLSAPTKRYWLGREENEEEWVRTTQGRFGAGGQKGLRIKVPENGVGERERRARSGTGPPPMYKPKGGKAPQ